MVLFCPPLPQQSADVVSYFTTHGHNAVKKLFYLNARKREPTRRCPRTTTHPHT